MDSAKQIIAQHFLLKDMPPADLDRLAELAHTRFYGRDQMIFLKGDSGTALMAVLSGRVRICSSDSDGHEIILNVIGPGEVFGEIALLDGGTRTASAFAMEPTKLLMFSRQDFLSYLEQYPQACIKVVELLCKRLRWVSDQFDDLCFLSPYSRVVKRLLHLAECYGEATPKGLRIRIGLSQKMLARMLGISRQAVNTQLSRLKKEGLIAVERTSITIIKREELLHIGDEGR